MTPEQARQLLEGTTPGPWEHEGRQPYIDSENFVIRQVGKPGVRIRGAAYGDTANIDLIAAAPDMANMIAGMVPEYAVQVRRSGEWQWSREEDDFRWQPLTVQMVRADRDHPREETRIVRRYVTYRQPLGDEQ